MRFLSRLACLLAGLAACAVAVAQPAAPVAPPPRLKRASDAEVGRLIAQVGSQVYAEREAATEELKRRPEAQAAVEKALVAATNPEVSRRLGTVSAALKRGWARRRLAKLPEYVKHRQFDRLVETMVLCREYLSEEHDTHVRAFIKGVYDDATGGKPHRFTSDEHWPGFNTFAWKYRAGGPEVFEGNRSVIARVVTNPERRTAICASERVGPPLPATGGWAVLFNNVILCNGDVEAFSIDNCFVVASGSILIHSSSSGNVVVGLDEVRMLSADCSVVVSRGRFERRRNDGSVIRADDKSFFNNWMLFSQADTGADLVDLFGVVWVTSVTPHSPFDRAGARPGDILKNVDGAHIRSVSDASRFLCRAAVGRGDADLTLMRNGQVVRAAVTLQLWD